MVNSYKLVNPHIEGKFKTEMKAKNSQDAANSFYKNLSEHFNNSVRQFNFSVQKGLSGDGKLYHFQVKEKRENNEVDFKITPLKIKGENEVTEKFKEKLANFKEKFNSLEGGKKKKSKKSKKSKDSSDSSDSSDSDSDLTENFYKRAKKYLPVNQPIYYWWYDPYLYGLDSVYLPTFYSYVTPYIELTLKY
jgi:hypothetical protein